MNSSNPSPAAIDSSLTIHGFEADQSHAWPAWLLSVFLHATVLIAFGLLSPMSAQPAPGESERRVAIAMVERSADNVEQYFSPGDGNTGSTDASATSSSADDSDFQRQLPSLDSLSHDLATTLPAPGSTSAAAASSGLDLPDASSLTRGAGGNPGKLGAGGQAQTQVFGAQGTGNKFVYVFDRSSSMGGFEGRPLASAKAELTRSLADLSTIHQFQIVFYNERPAVFNPFAPSRPTMLFATDENRQLAQEFVGSIRALGGTHHREAIELAIGMSPDVIFFLTDANEPGLTANELENVKRRNRAGTTINTIEFGVGPNTGIENFLVRLARQNRGSYVYVDVTALKP